MLDRKWMIEHEARVRFGGLIAIATIAGGIIISAASLIMAAGDDPPTRPEYCTAENISALIPALNLLDQERRNLVWLSQQRGMGDPAYVAPDLVDQYQGAQDLLIRLMRDCVST